MDTHEDYDADLFDVLHRAIDAASISERRADERHEYLCVQLVAPYLNGEMPDQAAFRHVPCHDLSLRGFSFVSSAKPDYDQLIVALGKAPFTFAVADVVRIAAMEAGGPLEYKVGCRFLHKLT